MIKPIDTYYNGNFFRSRLEARWAVCFELSDIRYEYELEGYELQNGIKYLPDFYLPFMDSHVEVKPEYQFTEKKGQQITPYEISLHSDYIKKWLPFTEHNNLIILIGNPGRFMCWQMKKDFFKYQLDERIGPIMGVPKELHLINRNNSKVIEANKKRFDHL